MTLKNKQTKTILVPQLMTVYIIQLIDESFGLQNVRNQGNAYVTHNFPEQKGDIRFQDTNSLKGDPENRYIRNEASELIETDSQSF